LEKTINDKKNCTNKKLHNQKMLKKTKLPQEKHQKVGYLFVFLLSENISEYFFNIILLTQQLHFK